MADLKISDLNTASSINETDNVELSQSVNNVLVSTKASILSIATKILSGINFNTLSTSSKNIIGAINEASQSGGGSLPNYSTSEHLLGRKWIDGKDIYEKTIEIPALGSSSGSTEYTVSSTDTINLIDYEGYIQFASGNKVPVPYISTLQPNYEAFVASIINIQLQASGKIFIWVGQDRSSASATITVRYTKSS